MRTFLVVILLSACGSEPDYYVVQAPPCGAGTWWSEEHQLCIASFLKPGLCGNGVINDGEGCDDGNSDINDDCPSGPEGSCHVAFCGDGYVNEEEQETCDGDAWCREDCTSPVGYPGNICAESFTTCYVGECVDGECVE